MHINTTISSDDIYSALESEIINLKIKPGACISEGELCARFEVSRTPIRSVLQRLELNGFVTIAPYKCTKVTYMDFDVINQTIYQRVAVESMVFRDFMKVCTPMHIEKMRYFIRSSRVLIQQEEYDINEVFSLNNKLHMIWFREMKKEYLWNCIQSAQSNYSRFRVLDIMMVERDYSEIIKEHEELLDILIRNDYESVEPWFIRHMHGGIIRLGEQVYTELRDYFVFKD